MALNTKLIESNYCLNHAMVAKLYHPCRPTQFPDNVLVSHWRIVTFSAHRDFLIIAPCNS